MLRPVSPSPTSPTKIRLLPLWQDGHHLLVIFAALSNRLIVVHEGAKAPGGGEGAVGARIPVAEILGRLRLGRCAAFTPSGGPTRIIVRNPAPGREIRSPPEGAQLPLQRLNFSQGPEN